MAGTGTPLVRRGIVSVAVAASLFIASVQAADAAGSDRVDSLLDVYEQARQSDPELRGQRFEVKSLRAQRREREGALLPDVSISGEIGRVNRDQSTPSAFGGGLQRTERTFTQESYGFTVTQPLFDRPAEYRIDSSERDVDAGEASLEARHQELIARTAEAYLQVLSAQSNVTLSQRELEAIEASRERTEALYDAGMAAVTDMEDVRARFDEAKANVIRAEGELDVALERLSQITDQRHQELAELQAGAELPELQPRDIQVWVDRALSQNPELLAAQKQVEGRLADVRAARAERLPTVDLAGGYSFRDDLDGSTLGSEREDLRISLQVQIPLYQGGSVGARSRSARYERARVAEQRERTRRTIRGDVRAAFSAIVSGESEVAALEQAIRSAERRVDAITQEVEAGTRPVVDLLDAQSELFSARRDLAEARHEYLINTLDLRRAAGELDGQDVAALDRMFTADPRAGE